MKRLILLVLGLGLAAPTQSAIIGGDAPACAAGEGPAIRADVIGLKDRRGVLALELYPANEDDFLKGDHALQAQGKVFRRIRVSVPQSGAIAICMRVPHPGRYALFLAHDRDDKPKFSFWTDGAGFPGAGKIGRARPKLAQALIEVGPGITETSIRMQYLRGFGGFSPLN